jgi:hypothetical protein
MSMNQTVSIVVAIVVIVVVLAIIGWILSRRRRSEHLRKQFGPEYDHAIAHEGGRAQAEAELAKREKRVAKLDIRPLEPAQRQEFVDRWKDVQARFVDDPARAVADADGLLGQVMSARGYPVSDFEQRAGDISVDHPEVVKNYRAGHDIALRHEKGNASTEDLRQAMIHYRALFDELVSDSAAPAAAQKETETAH